MVSQPSGEGGQPTLFDWVRENLLSLDHVGSTLHFEGYDAHDVAELVREALGSLGLTRREEALPRSEGTTYTFLSSVKGEKPIFLWVTVYDHEGPITIVETRIAHTTEDSAFADELLADFTSRLQTILDSSNRNQ
ncbi:MAG: hypothetical protein QW514_07895 [Thermoprotei archaeon]